MAISNKLETAILFMGDILLFSASLWFMLLIRYGSVPSENLFDQHLLPFSILFIIWVIIFYIAGLYEKHTTVFKRSLSKLIFSTQIVNIVVAVLFFYFIPYFSITPKTNLFIYLVISSLLIFLWRFYGSETFGFKKKIKALAIGTGDEVAELREEVNQNPRYGLVFVSSLDVDELDGVDFEEEILPRIYSENVHLIAVDLKSEKIAPLSSRLYNLIFSKIRFVDINSIYEGVFDRIPLSLVRHNWFLENISVSSKPVYDALKRFMDIFVSFILGFVSLLFYPFVYLSIKMDDGGSIFITQERVGKDNQPIKIHKFRTMTTNDGGNESQVMENKFTKIGPILRRSRIDELPQLWDVLKGDLSLIGPRPELPALAKKYEEEIPYYNIRHLIKPGLSGWAQLYHKNPPRRVADFEKTRGKLSYDLFYIKNRSFVLDLKIALKTLKTFATRSGS